MEPVIIINSHDPNGHSTMKPLPALLAPNSSCGSLPTGILVRQDTTLDLSPLPRNTTPLPAYYSVIQKQSQEIQELRQDLAQLSQKYMDQSDRLHSAEQAQVQSASEIEDLSCTLFEQANEMVATEKKARFEAEQKIQQLEQRLSHVVEELSNEKSQLSELKDKLHHQETTPTTPDIYLENDTLFIEFMNVVKTTPLDQLNRIPFMKQCLELDVEPCLRFGNKKNNGQTKKLLDTILYQPCYIEPARRHSLDTFKPAPPVRRSSLNFIYSKSRTEACCYTCGVSLEKCTLFRFKLREQDKDWFWIERSCRDRLVAVCNFYVFIRHVKQGLTSQKPIDLLVKECLWLRLCMFWARTGVYQQKEGAFNKDFLIPANTF